MNAVLAQLHPSRNKLLLCFACLQLLDLATTLAVFSCGGSELNPVIRSLIPFTGVLGAVFVSKALLLWLAWRFSQRNWILYSGIGIYSAIVTWNFVLFLIAS